MKYAWIEEVEIVDGDEILNDDGLSFEPPQYEQVEQGTGNGAVTGMNRAGGEGEQTGTMNYQVDGVWGMDSEKYKVLSYIFTPLTKEEVEDIETQEALDKSLETAIVNITAAKKDANLEDFQYEDHMYTSDANSIQAVAIEAGTMSAEDLIPVPNGVWKTADTEDDGLTPVYVRFTCGEYALFKTAYYTRSSKNFGVKEYHKNNVKQMYLNGSTAEEIDEYDYSQGWS